MEKKTSAFVQIPIWLIGELTGNEIKLFLIMYNGWRMMKNLSNGNTYYRSYKKLKEDLGIKSKNSNKVIDAIRHFEELGILRVERDGKKTNHYEFNEFVLFHSNDVPETGIRDVPETGTSKPIDDVPETGTIYNTKENMNDIIHDCILHVTEEKNEPLDIELELEPEKDINNMLEYTCTGEDNSKNQHNMKIDERLITEVEKDAWEILDISDDFDYSQYENISEMVQSDARNIGMLENPTYFEKKKNNEYVSKEFKKLSYYIKEYKNSTSVEMANEWGCKVNDLYGSLDRSKFTESQLGTISDMMDEFDFLFECKEKFLSKKYHKTKKTVSSENSIISDGLSDSEHCPSPAPSIEKEDNMMIMRATMSEDEIAQLSKKSTKHEEKKYGKYDSVEQCLKAFDEKWELTTQEPMVAYGNNSVQ